MYRIIHAHLETGLNASLRSNVRVMNLGDDEILVLNGKHKGLRGKVFHVIA